MVGFWVVLVCGDCVCLRGVGWLFAWYFLGVFLFCFFDFDGLLCLHLQVGVHLLWMDECRLRGWIMVVLDG